MHVRSRDVGDSIAVSRYRLAGGKVREVGDVVGLVARERRREVLDRAVVRVPLGVKRRAGANRRPPAERVRRRARRRRVAPAEHRAQVRAVARAAARRRSAARARKRRRRHGVAAPESPGRRLGRELGLDARNLELHAVALELTAASGKGEEREILEF